MDSVLILGAAGQIARHAIVSLLKKPNIRLTLYLRNSKRIEEFASARTNIIEGDVADTTKLKDSMKGQDIVYANLDGEMELLALNIVNAMRERSVKRLIFITSLGIYDEVPGKFGKWNNEMIGQYLVPYRKAADIIEASDLEYTIIRPAWLTDEDKVDYEITEKNEPFKGTEVSRKSVADLVVKLIENPERKTRRSLGVNKPNTNGDKPSFY